MTDVVRSATGYYITAETFNGFFGIWLKRNLFTQRRLIITLVLSAAFFLYAAISLWPILSDMFNGPDLPFALKIVGLGLLVTLELLLCFMMMAVPVYILSPILSYVWLFVSFMTGPVRKRINNAELSEQGITKSYQAYRAITPWHTVQDLVETRKSLLIFTSRNSAMMIPKAAFATKEQVDAFWLTARQYWELAEHSPSS